MDEELDARFGSQKLALSAESQAHVAGCKRCGALLRALEQGPAMADPQLNLESVQRSLLRDLRPVRPLAPSWVFLLVVAVIFIAFLAIGVYRLGPFGWAALSVPQKLAIFSALFASAALLSFAAVSQMVPGTKIHIAPGLAPIGAFVLIAIAVAAVLDYEQDPDFVETGMGCLIAGTPYALPSGFLFWLLLRRGVVLRPLLTGAMSGMLAGLIGTSVLEVHCPILDLWHVLVWHLGVCVLGALVGLFAGWAGSRTKLLLEHR